MFFKVFKIQISKWPPFLHFLSRIKTVIWLIEQNRLVTFVYKRLFPSLVSICNYKSSVFTVSYYNVHLLNGCLIRTKFTLLSVVTTHWKCIVIFHLVHVQLVFIVSKMLALLCVYVGCIGILYVLYWTSKHLLGTIKLADSVTQLLVWTYLQWFASI